MTAPALNEESVVKMDAAQLGKFILEHARELGQPVIIYIPPAEDEASDIQVLTLDEPLLMSQIDPDNINYEFRVCADSD